MRRVPYLVETERIHDPGDGPLDAVVRVSSRPCAIVPGPRRDARQTTGPQARAARDAFALMWDAHGPAEPTPAAMPVGEVLPDRWVRYVRHESLNPAQQAVLPEVLHSDRNLVVVAPTGAGKTVIGMAAALKTMLGQRRRAVWLVPQRSLTDELDRDLDGWRHQGLSVERLSGEYPVHVERLRSADLWVATTEKFEALCRTAVLREAIDAIGCIVVDEVHLLGDETRGSTLEALLARVRGCDVRVVGLSATVANADEIAQWLQAKLVQITWRASRLSWQLPTVAAHRDWNITEAARTRLVAAISRLVTGDGGGVLVFCGSKRNVRRTALVVAAGRGADVTGVHPDDVQRVHQACRAAGVGLHYQGWEHRHDTELAFRERRLDVLVATPTVATGVNLPARAVVVRDTQVGLERFDVATVQQMFGRAGRVGAGEREGYAFLLVDENERAEWQARLVAGNTVRSRIQANLPDHVLGEVVRGDVTTVDQARRWWLGTFAFHQGDRGGHPLRDATRFLDRGGLIAVQGEVELAPTELGALTARLMIPTTVGDALRTALADGPPPADPDSAEHRLVDILATYVPKLAQASAGEHAAAAVTNLVAAGGRVLDGTFGCLDGPFAEAPASEARRGDLARAALLTVANTPELFGGNRREVAGVPAAAMYPVLEEAPRYLHWLASQGIFGTVHPWVAIVAADLGRRVRWRRCQPRRGAGRLLWMCEQMTGTANLHDGVPRLWHAAAARGHRSPDWRAGAPPALCELDAGAYRELLRERATDVCITVDSTAVRASGPASSVLTHWTQDGHRLTPLRRGVATAALPAGGCLGAAVFTWRGDYRATGWLTAYHDHAAPRAAARTTAAYATAAGR